MENLDPKYQPLFESWKIKDLEIKNRIVLAPMGGTSLFGWMNPAGNKFNEEAAKFFLERARNNVGLIITGIAPIKSMFMNQWLYKGKKMYQKLSTFMDELHTTGAKLFIQITAGMGRSFAIPTSMVKLHNLPVIRDLIKPIFDIQYQSASPSRLPSRWSDKVTCREMTQKEIDKIVKAFAKTAKMCMDAGVDGIEVHAVHEGYLLDQFATEYTNHRADEYGGSLENRLRFATDIVKAIKAECGDSFPVSIRYSATSKVKEDAYAEEANRGKKLKKNQAEPLNVMGAIPGEAYIEVGRDMDESLQAVKILEEAGYDMLNADNGTYDSWYWAHPPMYMPKNCNLEDVAQLKTAVSIPVVCAGRMEPEVGAQAVSAGRIDAMGVGRQFLADGEWVTKLIENRIEDIRPCICCHNACFNMSHYKGVANAQSIHDASHIARCALDPTVMQSKKYKIEPAKVVKNVAVIGGGIGGMESALVLAKRGHNVVLYESTGRLGGAYIAASAFSFKEKDRELLAWYERELKKYSNIRVELYTTVKDLENLYADEIIVATGAKPVKPKIKGLDRAIPATDYLLGKQPVYGSNVIVIGGGLTGCEVAYDLYLKGQNPTIIEMNDDLMVSKTVPFANSSYLRDFFMTNYVELYLNTKLHSVTYDGILAKDKEGKFTLKCDHVITALGYEPAPAFKKGKHVHLVGDASEVGNLRTVIWNAWDVCMKI